MERHITTLACIFILRVLHVTSLTVLHHREADFPETDESTHKSDDEENATKILEETWGGDGTDSSERAEAEDEALSVDRDKYFESEQTDREAWWSNRMENQPQIIFLAGVEGAGHEIVQAAWRDGFPGASATAAPLVDNWRCGGNWTASDMEILVARMKKLEPGRLSTFPQLESHRDCWRNLGFDKDTGDDDRERARLDWIAEAARRANVGLRVLLLQRNLEGCLAATCLRRAGNCSKQAADLTAGAKLLTAQLKTVDPSRISCLEYGDMTSMRKEVEDAFDAPKKRERILDDVSDEAAAYFNKQDPQWHDYVDSMLYADRSILRVCKAVSKFQLTDIKKIVTGPLNRKTFENAKLSGKSTQGANFSQLDEIATRARSPAKALKHQPAASASLD